MTPMSAAPETSASQPVDLDIAAGQAIAACGGDAREAVKELLVAKRFVGFNFSGRTGCVPVASTAEKVNVPEPPVDVAVMLEKASPRTR